MTHPTHTAVHIPDEAVQAMPERIYAMHREDTKHCIVAFEEFSADHIEYVRADVAAAHLYAPCAVEAVDVAVVSRMAARADDYDVADDNGEFPDIQDVMVALGELRVLRRILSNVVTKPVDVAVVYREALERISKFDRTHGSWETIAYDAINIAGRALSAEPAQSEQWQPIETAPKDGTCFDVWMHPHSYRETDVFWSDIQGAWCTVANIRTSQLRFHPDLTQPTGCFSPPPRPRRQANEQVYIRYVLRLSHVLV